MVHMSAVEWRVKGKAQNYFGLFYWVFHEWLLDYMNINRLLQLKQ